MSAALCIHCGDPLVYHPASPRGPKGWEHGGVASAGHPAIPADMRTEPDERARQKSQEAILRHLDKASNFAIFGFVPPNFNDRRT